MRRSSQTLGLAIESIPQSNDVCLRLQKGFCQLQRRSASINNFEMLTPLLTSTDFLNLEIEARSCICQMEFAPYTNTKMTQLYLCICSKFQIDPTDQILPIFKHYTLHCAGSLLNVDWFEFGIRFLETLLLTPWHKFLEFVVSMIVSLLSVLTIDTDEKALLSLNVVVCDVLNSTQQNDLIMLRDAMVETYSKLSLHAWWKAAVSLLEAVVACAQWERRCSGVGDRAQQILNEVWSKQMTRLDLSAESVSVVAAVWAHTGHLSRHAHTAASHSLAIRYLVAMHEQGRVINSYKISCPLWSQNVILATAAVVEWLNLRTDPQLQFELFEVCEQCRHAIGYSVESSYGLHILIEHIKHSHDQPVPPHNFGHQDIFHDILASFKSKLPAASIENAGDWQLDTFCALETCAKSMDNFVRVMSLFQLSQTQVCTSCLEFRRELIEIVLDLVQRLAGLQEGPAHAALSARAQHVHISRTVGCLLVPLSHLFKKLSRLDCAVVEFCAAENRRETWKFWLGLAKFRSFQGEVWSDKESVVVAQWHKCVLVIGAHSPCVAKHLHAVGWHESTPLSACTYNCGVPKNLFIEEHSFVEVIGMLEGARVQLSLDIRPIFEYLKLGLLHLTSKLIDDVFQSWQASVSQVIRNEANLFTNLVEIGIYSGNGLDSIVTTVEFLISCSCLAASGLRIVAQRLALRVLHSFPWVLPTARVLQCLLGHCDNFRLKHEHNPTNGVIKYRYRWVDDSVQGGLSEMLDDWCGVDELASHSSMSTVKKQYFIFVYKWLTSHRNPIIALALHSYIQQSHSTDLIGVSIANEILSSTTGLPTYHLTNYMGTNVMSMPERRRAARIVAYVTHQHGNSACYGTMRLTAQLVMYAQDFDDMSRLDINMVVANLCGELQNICTDDRHQELRKQSVIWRAGIVVWKIMTNIQAAQNSVVMNVWRLLQLVTQCWQSKDQTQQAESVHECLQWIVQSSLGTVWSPIIQSILVIIFRRTMTQLACVDPHSSFSEERDTCFESSQRLVSLFATKFLHISSNVASTLLSTFTITLDHQNTFVNRCATASLTYWSALSHMLISCIAFLHRNSIELARVMKEQLVLFVMNITRASSSAVSTNSATGTARPQQVVARMHEFLLCLKQDCDIITEVNPYQNSVGGMILINQHVCGDGHRWAGVIWPLYLFTMRGDGDMLSFIEQKMDQSQVNVLKLCMDRLVDQISAWNLAHVSETQHVTVSRPSRTSTVLTGWRMCPQFVLTVFEHNANVAWGLALSAVPEIRQWPVDWKHTEQFDHMMYVRSLSLLDCVWSTCLDRHVNHNSRFAPVFFGLLCRSIQDFENSSVSCIIGHLPLLAQLLRRDDFDLIFNLLVELAVGHAAVRHRLWWLCSSFTRQKHANTMSSDDYLPILARSLASALELALSPTEKFSLADQCNFYDGITEISDKFAVSKDRHNQDAIVQQCLIEFFNSVQVHPKTSLCLPFSPFLRLTSMLDQHNFTVRCLQSSARCPLLVDFNTEGGTSVEMIFKCPDDCRQDLLALQVIEIVSQACKRSQLNVSFAAYDIIATTSNSGKLGGIIEVVKSCQSLDSLGAPLRQHFINTFGDSDKLEFVAAQSQFATSLAAYSVICYLLAVKDRHDGNILLDNSTGRVIHIDFGFLLGLSPGGNLGFEQAPFKLTSDMMNLLGGAKSAAFKLFKTTAVRVFLAARSVRRPIVALVKVHSESGLACFQLASDSCAQLHERFLPSLGHTDAARRFEQLIRRADNHWTTWSYDKLQQMQHNIRSTWK